MPKKIMKPARQLPSDKSFQVKQIIGRRMVQNGINEYFVIWNGFRENEGSWVPQTQIMDQKDKINQYLTISRQKSSKKKKCYKKARRQLKLYNKEKIETLQELKKVLQKSTKQHIEKNNLTQADRVTGFQKLLTKPADQYMKVDRFDIQTDSYEYKMQKVVEVIGKCATLEKRKANLFSGQIQILNVTEINDEKIVRFQKNGRNYQCRLELLRILCPLEVIDYLLQCYNPATNIVANNTINLDADLQK